MIFIAAASLHFQKPQRAASYSRSGGWRWQGQVRDNGIWRQCERQGFPFLFLKQGLSLESPANGSSCSAITNQCQLLAGRNRFSGPLFFTLHHLLLSRP